MAAVWRRAVRKSVHSGLAVAWPATATHGIMNGLFATHVNGKKGPPLKRARHEVTKTNKTNCICEAFGTVQGTSEFQCVKNIGCARPLAGQNFGMQRCSSPVWTLSRARAMGLINTTLRKRVNIDSQAPLSQRRTHN